MSGTESVEPRPDRQVASDGRMSWQYRHTVLSLCMLAFLVTYFARLAISPVVPLIVDDFTVSNTAIGVALSGMWLAYGAAQFPSGVLADRYGERRVILVAVGGTTAMSVVLALAPVFPAFVLAAVVSRARRRAPLRGGDDAALPDLRRHRDGVRASLRGRAARRARGARRRRVGRVPVRLAPRGRAGRTGRRAGVPAVRVACPPD